MQQSKVYKCKINICYNNLSKDKQRKAQICTAWYNLLHTANQFMNQLICTASQRKIAGKIVTYLRYAYIEFSCRHIYHKLCEGIPINGLKVQLLYNNLLGRESIYTNLFNGVNWKLACCQKFRVPDSENKRMTPHAI